MEDKYWSDRFAGYDVLMNNLRLHQQAYKEITDFIRERLSIEEVYARALQRLSKSFTVSVGSFDQWWQLLLGSCDSLGSAHLKYIADMQQMQKSVKETCDKFKDYAKQVKEETKLAELSRADVLNLDQLVKKSKTTYVQRIIEYEKAKLEGKAPGKMEIRMKKATEEYRDFVKKREAARLSYLHNFKAAVEVFEREELRHLGALKLLTLKHSSCNLSLTSDVTELNQNLVLQLDERPPEKVLQAFVERNALGTQPPGPVEFEEFTVDVETLKKAIGKKEIKKKSSKSSKVPSSSSTLQVDPQTSQGNIYTDSEGFRIRPEETLSNKSQEQDSFDSDSGGDEGPKKIKVTIRPVTDDLLSTSAIPISVDTIRDASSGTSLSGGSGDHSIQQTTSFSNLGDCEADEHSDTKSVGSVGSTSKDLRSSFSKLSDSSGGLDKSSIYWNACSVPTPTNRIISPSHTGDGYSVSRKLDMMAKFPAAPPSRRTQKISTSHLAVSPDDGPTRLAGSPVLGSTRSDPSPSQDLSPWENFESMPSAMPRGHLGGGLSKTKSMPFPEAVSATGLLTTTTLTSGKFPGPASHCLSKYYSFDGAPPSNPYPVAVALLENVAATLKGRDLESMAGLGTITGSLAFSFMTPFMNDVIQGSPVQPCSFMLSGNTNWDQSIVNKAFLQTPPPGDRTDPSVYSVNMGNLTETIKTLLKKNPEQPFINLDFIKYQVSVTGATALPLLFSASWTSSNGVSSVEVRYKFNPAMFCKSALLQAVSFVIPITGSIELIDSEPLASWFAEQQRLIWRFQPDPGSSLTGRLRASYRTDDGAANREYPVGAQFLVDSADLGTTCVELTNDHYKLSLMKRKISSGRYVWEP